MKLTHDSIERNVGLLIILTILVVSVGGLLEIVPLFFQKSTTTPVDGLGGKVFQHDGLARERGTTQGQSNSAGAGKPQAGPKGSA